MLSISCRAAPSITRRSGSTGPSSLPTAAAGQRCWECALHAGRLQPSAMPPAATNPAAAPHPALHNLQNIQEGPQGGGKGHACLANEADVTIEVDSTWHPALCRVQYHPPGAENQPATILPCAQTVVPVPVPGRAAAAGWLGGVDAGGGVAHLTCNPVTVAQFSATFKVS